MAAFSLHPLSSCLYPSAFVRKRGDTQFSVRSSKQNRRQDIPIVLRQRQSRSERSAVILASRSRRDGGATTEIGTAPCGAAYEGCKFNEGPAELVVVTLYPLAFIR